MIVNYNLNKTYLKTGTKYASCVSVIKCFRIYILVTMLFSGCARSLPSVETPLPPSPFKVSNVYRASIPKSLVRVGLLPVYGLQDISLQESIYGELFKQLIFEWIKIEPSTLQQAYHQSTFSSIEQLPHGFFDFLQKQYNLDGLLLIDITHYQPYYPIQIGMRAQLIELQTKRTLWMADEIFDANDIHVQSSIQQYQHDNSTHSFETFNNKFLNSPSAFTSFAAHTLFSQLAEKI